jgi:protein-S-isoprenylcysteine O-methyltransferase Ste14
MVEPVVVTILPALFLIVLFGGGALARRKNIDMDGEAPIDRRVFYVSKYSIVLIWTAMVLRGWGVDLSVAAAPGILRWVALCLWVFGFTLLFIGRLGLGAHFRIGSPKENTGLIVDGIFGLSRNPMYVGVYATILASICYTLNPIVFLIGVFVVVVHHRIVVAEEQYLLKVVGREYADYCGRVRRYL